MSDALFTAPEEEGWRNEIYEGLGENHFDQPVEESKEDEQEETKVERNQENGEEWEVHGHRVDETDEDKEKDESGPEHEDEERHEDGKKAESGQELRRSKRKISRLDCEELDRSLQRISWTKCEEERIPRRI